jgi:hypothetical protein
LEIKAIPAGLQITMVDVMPDDPALHQAFIDLFTQDDAVLKVDGPENCGIE